LLADGTSPRSVNGVTLAPALDPSHSLRVTIKFLDILFKLLLTNTDFLFFSVFSVSLWLSSISIYDLIVGDALFEFIPYIHRGMPGGKILGDEAPHIHAVIGVVVVIHADAPG